MMEVVRMEFGSRFYRLCQRLSELVSDGGMEAFDGQTVHE